MPVKAEEPADDARRKVTPYAVPAVEKALDVLELLSNSSDGMSMKDLADTLGRSMGELYRVVVYLERRGYVSRDDDRYALSLRMFEIANRHPPLNRLVEQAAPILEYLAVTLEQSCHVGVIFDDRFLVLAVASSPRPMSYTVRIGATFPLFETSSGAVLCAYLPEARQRILTERIPDPDIRMRISSILEHGYERMESRAVKGIVNLSAPVFDYAGIAGALTVPYLDQLGLTHDKDRALDLLVKASMKLSRALGCSSNSNYRSRSTE